MASLWIVHCMDSKEGGIVQSTPRSGYQKRMEHYDEHKKYQGATADANSANYIKKVAAGPLLSDDGSSMVGSCFILDATKEEVDAFVRNDPFHKAGVWKTEDICIHRYISIPNGILAHE